jgi:hypothetical protein
MYSDPAPDPDPANFVSDLQDDKNFYVFLFFEATLHHFTKIKSHKEVTKQ